MLWLGHRNTRPSPRVRDSGAYWCRSLPLGAEPGSRGWGRSRRERSRVGASGSPGLRRRRALHFTPTARLQTRRPAPAALFRGDSQCHRRLAAEQSERYLGRRPHRPSVSASVRPASKAVGSQSCADVAAPRRKEHLPRRRCSALHRIESSCAWSLLGAGVHRLRCTSTSEYS
jgi:hypothetical protein